MQKTIFLDIETTGLRHKDGHKIIEISVVEKEGEQITRAYQLYINPKRKIDAGAFEIHGISDAFLKDKPTFDEVAEDFFNCINGATLVIHNAPFDLGFLDSELAQLKKGYPPISQVCTVVDTLALAKELFPFKKTKGRRFPPRGTYTLDALCKRFRIDNSARNKHEALMDAQILVDVYSALIKEKEKQKSSPRQLQQHVSMYRPGIFKPQGRKISQKDAVRIFKKSVIDANKQESTTNNDRPNFGPKQ
ncbi:MAG: DNA polymerase III subunit epsilon [Pseudomonadota bacterium]